MYGKHAAAEIATFEASQVQAIKKLVEKEKIDCHFNLTRAFDVILDEDLARRVKVEYDQLLADGFPTLKDVWYFPGPAAGALSGVKGAKCAFSFTVGSLWPYKLATHLLSLALKKGVNLQMNTPVHNVSEAPDAEGRWTVSTPRGQIKAKKVVFATNSRIAAPEGGNAPSLPFSYSVRHNAKGADYQITRPDGSIIVGGGRPFYIHKGEQWYNVHDDSKLIEPAVPYFDGLMQRTYRGWENSGAKVDRVWTGIMGYTNDLMPHVGEIPSRKGLYICAGFNGHGMPSIFLSCKGLTKMIREGCPFKGSGVPAPYETSLARLENQENKVTT